MKTTEENAGQKDLERHNNFRVEGVYGRSVQTHQLIV